MLKMNPTAAPFGISARSRNQSANPIRDLLRLIDNPSVLSFAGGLPDAGLFPRDAFEGAMSDVLNDATLDPLQYGPTIGSERLRSRLAQMMSERYSIPCDASNIMLTTGSQQGIDLAVRVLHDPDQRIAVETPTYLGALQVFRAAGAEIVDFEDPCLGTGPVTALGYLIPDFCNPTGVSLDVDARRAHLAKARGGSYMLLEDAAYTELTYDGPCCPSLLALDCAETGSIERARTLFLGTFSKTLMPGLRVGWVCGPADVIARMVRMKESVDILSTRMMQEVAYLLLDKVFDEHVLTLRRTYRRRRDAMMAALKTHMPGEVSWTHPGGGMFTWLTLPEGMDAEILLPRCISEVGLAYVPGRHFMACHQVDNVLRMSFSSYEPPVIEDAIARFGAFLGRIGREAV